MNEVQITVDGSGRAHVRIIPSWRSRITLYGGALLVAVLIATCIQLYLVLLHRFEANYELRNRIDTARTEVPTDSALNEALVSWVQENAKTRVSPQLAQFIVSHTFDEAVQQRVDPFTMLAMMKVESEFDFKARSGAGALGLLQVIPSMHAERKINTVNALDPALNIHVGTAVLREYMDWYGGNLDKALLQYNGSLDMPGASYAHHVRNVQTQLEDYVQGHLRVEVANGV